MSDLQMNQAPVMTTGMLIRRPVAEVFDAVIDPAKTTRFWFTRSSGRLEAGKQVTWAWEMYDAEAVVTVRAIDPDRRILIEWPGQSVPTTVEWVFTGQPDGSTYVNITDHGFTGTGDEIVRDAMDSTQGFSLVLAGLNAYLEHGIELNLVQDRYAKTLVVSA